MVRKMRNEGHKEPSLENVFDNLFLDVLTAMPGAGPKDIDGDGDGDELVREGAGWMSVTSYVDGG